jgi:hypothetical protein
MSPRFLKTAAAVYIVKVVAFLVLWIAVPDLPHRAAATIRDAWTHISATRP